MQFKRILQKKIRVINELQFPQIRKDAYFGTEDDSADAQIHVCTVHKVVIWIAAVENLRERAALFLQESSPTPPVAKLL